LEITLLERFCVWKDVQIVGQLLIDSRIEGYLISLEYDNLGDFGLTKGWADKPIEVIVAFSQNVVTVTVSSGASQLAAFGLNIARQPLRALIRGRLQINSLRSDTADHRRKTSILFHTAFLKEMRVVQRVFLSFVPTETALRVRHIKLSLKVFVPDRNYKQVRNVLYNIGDPQSTNKCLPATAGIPSLCWSSSLDEDSNSIESSLMNIIAC
jgi:hypothetical protein